MKLLYKSTLRNLSMLSVTVSMLFACGGGNNESTSTGWKINDEDNGGFQAVTDYQEQATGPGLVFIEGGTFSMGRVQDDVMHDWNNTPTQMHVHSFYMDESEVTNISYREYLYWLKRVFPPTEEAYKYIHQSALPDTLVWRNRLGSNEAFVTNYLRHPAFNDYPVVGVNWIQATKYAEWRTDRVNEKILTDMGVLNDDINKMKGESPTVTADNHFTTDRYLKDPNSVFGDKNKEAYGDLLEDMSPNRDSSSLEGRHVMMEDGILLPKYRLPTEAEWEFAATALEGNREFNTIKGKKKFPWNGRSARSKSRRTKGDLLANFKPGKGDYSGVAGWSNDGADITNKVKSYPPNDYGLYDMAGNAAEWVADVYRPNIDGEANDFSYYRGNVFKQDSVNEYGEMVVTDSESIVYDTLSSGKLIPRNLPGEVATADVKPNNTYMRTNYYKADNINYLDGDSESGKDYGKLAGEKKADMYNSPDYKFKKDSLGNPNFKKYDTKTRTSLINDKVRVYKGGSWADRIYWLDPAQRRYLMQDMATNFIGFRCAMDRVGSGIVNDKTPY